MTIIPERAFMKREIEAAFIDGHWRYGSSIHEKAAEALATSLGEPADTPTGHALFSRLFGEYAASLETFAAWGWSLRGRVEPGSFLDNYQGSPTNRTFRRYFGLPLSGLTILPLTRGEAPRGVERYRLQTVGLSGKRSWVGTVTATARG
jgi:hypothetical protein